MWVFARVCVRKCVYVCVHVWVVRERDGFVGSRAPAVNQWCLGALVYPCTWAGVSVHVVRSCVCVYVSLHRVPNLSASARPAPSSFRRRIFRVVVGRCNSCVWEYSGGLEASCLLGEIGRRSASSVTRCALALYLSFAARSAAHRHWRGHLPRHRPRTRDAVQIRRLHRSPASASCSSIQTPSCWLEPRGYARFDSALS